MSEKSPSIETRGIEQIYSSIDTLVNNATGVRVGTINCSKNTGPDIISIYDGDTTSPESHTDIEDIDPLNDNTLVYKDYSHNGGEQNETYIGTTLVTSESIPNQEQRDRGMQEEYTVLGQKVDFSTYKLTSQHISALKTSGKLVLYV